MKKNYFDFFSIYWSNFTFWIFYYIIDILTDAYIIDGLLEMRYNLSNNFKIYIKNKIIIFLTEFFSEEVNDSIFISNSSFSFSFWKNYFFKTIFNIDYLIVNDVVVEIMDKGICDIQSYTDNLLKNIGNIGMKI